MTGVAIGMAGARRIVSAVLAGLVATGCISFGATDDGNGTSGTPSPQEAAVRLTSTGGDVFAWEQRIDGVGDCVSVAALVDGDESTLGSPSANGGLLLHGARTDGRAAGGGPLRG